MDAAMKIVVLLTAFDKMSDVIDSATDNAEKKMAKLMKKNFMEGTALTATGVEIVKSLAPAVNAYASLEQANTNLQASMMDNTGAIDANFAKVTELAEGLGDKLPGATKDFDEMFESMMNNGVKSQAILNGAGKAAAYLGVDFKMGYTEVGKFAAMMKEATGVADKDLLSFFDTLSKSKAMGMEVGEIEYAFKRSAGTLKLLDLQGIKAANDMSVLFSLWKRNGTAGETAATSFNSIVANILNPKKFEKATELANNLGIKLNFFKDGKFMGIDNMIAQFDKFKDFDTETLAPFINALTGGGQDASALGILIKKGTAGYQAMRAEMEKKAALNDKVNIKLKTLNSMWEATTGTIENMLAALGAGLAPILKPLVDTIGAVAGKIKELLSENPALAKFISLLIAMVGIAVTLVGVIKIIQGIRIAMALLNVTMKANPFILIASIAILAISLIYAHWGKIKAWFGKLWDGVKNAFRGPINAIKNILMVMFLPGVLIYKHWDKIKSFFSDSWEGVKGIFSGIIDWFKGIGDRFFQAGKNIINSIKDGIVSVAMAPFNAVKKIVGKIRNLLPFSPAKDGPLRDIHKIRLIETIADGIKPNALVNKMHKVAGLTWGALPGNSGAPSFAPVGNAGGSNTTINFTVNLSGGATETDAKGIMDEFEKRLPAMLKRYQGQKSRVTFG